MARVSLNLACGWYDRILPLMDKTVSPEGVELNILNMQPEELFWRMLQYGEFDASEMSLGAWLIMCGRKDNRFVGIPVFPSRMFRQSTIFINENKGVSKPEDLKGKKIGIPDYTLTAGLWQRGLFSDFYEINPEDVDWYTGGLHEGGRKQRIDWIPPEGVKLSYIGNNNNLNDMLVSGELDAIFTSRDIKGLKENKPGIRRLWKDSEAAEKEYYQKTKVFPIMHLLVVKRDIYEANPWIAVSLYKAFEQAKAICFNRMYSSTALTYSNPWSIRQIDEVRNIMGDDFWPYGIEKNLLALEKACEYAYKQGLTSSLLTPEDLFAPSVKELYKI